MTTINVYLGYRDIGKCYRHNQPSAVEMEGLVNIFDKYHFGGAHAHGMRLYAEEAAAREKLAEANRMAQRHFVGEIYRNKAKILQKRMFEVTL